MALWNGIGPPLLPDGLTAVGTRLEHQSSRFRITFQRLATELAANLIQQAEVTGAAEFSEKCWIPAHR